MEQVSEQKVVLFRKVTIFLHGLISGPVVFLQHCLLCSSADWLVNLRTESLAYLLANAGFDVWLGNVRGNTYSRAHVSLSPNDKKFWQFRYTLYNSLCQHYRNG